MSEAAIKEKVNLRDRRTIPRTFYGFARLLTGQEKRLSPRLLVATRLCSMKKMKIKIVPRFRNSG